MHDWAERVVPQPHETALELLLVADPLGEHSEPTKKISNKASGCDHKEAYRSNTSTARFQI